MLHLCAHINMIHDNGEVVCTKCGVVMEHSVEEDVPSDNSRANLYELKEVGSRNALPDIQFGQSRSSMDVRRYFRGRHIRRALSDFSNFCEKLALPISAQQRAWKMYCRAQSCGSRHGAAEHACWAVHNTCRAMGIPKSDVEIISVAKTSYGRANLPDMFTIAYRHMDIPGAAISGTDAYYFNLNLRKIVAGLALTKTDFVICKNEAWKMFLKVFVEGSPDHRARQAISTAFGTRQ